MDYSIYLKHHGILGQKWGVRRFQNKDGTWTEAGKKRYGNAGQVIKSGTIVKRVSTTKDDPIYDNKKYVSMNDEDHAEWESYIGKAYLDRNRATYTQTYVVVDDLKVMNSVAQGKKFTEMMLDRNFKEQAIKDISYSNRALGLSDSDDPAENISRNIAMQTETGKRFVQEVMKDNYRALEDTHGKNVSKNPMIILDAEQTLERYSQPEYTKPVQDFLRKYYAQSV